MWNREGACCGRVHSWYTRLKRCAIAGNRELAKLREAAVVADLCLLAAQRGRGTLTGMTWRIGINLERLEHEADRRSVDGETPRGVDALAEVETEVIVESLSNGWSAQAGNTALVMARLGQNAGFEPPSPVDPRSPYGRYWGRPIIGRDSPIDGGVYVGRKPREAIVVDMAKPGPMLDVYKAWLRELQVEAAVWPWQQTESGQRRAVRKYLQRNLLASVRALVLRELPFDRKVVAQVAQEHTLGPDDKVRLDVYLRRHGGVCRHQVCLVGALLERLIGEGWLEGAVSIDRKFVPKQYSHAWVRWTDTLGRPWILDAAQDVWGPLDDFEAERRWFYAREDEQPADE